MNNIFLLIIFVSIVVNSSKGCHHYDHFGGDDDYDDYDYGGRRKKRNVQLENSAVNLINFFTDCMTSSSNISLDWYSATDWTIEDSNWYFYTDTTDCAGEYGDNETACWINRVGSFVDENLSPTIQSCIQSYASGFSFNTQEENQGYERRKKRQASNGGRRGGTGGNGGRQGGGGNGENRNGGNRNGGNMNRINPLPQPPNPSRPPRPPRNSQCPSIPADYRRELMRLVPPSFRPPKPIRSRGKRSLEREFNIISVVDFIDNFTVCDECERYSGESARACFTDRFDRLTRYDSTLKSAIQRANSRYAEGGDTVGDCRGSVYWTQWFNTDNPFFGTGDSETLTRIRSLRVGQVCASPLGIQAQLSASMTPYGRGNNNLEISPRLGLICVNSRQTSGRCQDYRVRFCCRDYIGECPFGSSWTQYFNQVLPSSLGEFETFTSAFVRNQQNLVCSRPSAIGARLISTKTTFQLTGDTLHVRPTSGLICFNSQQQNGRTCGNYEVRYCCPAAVGTCSAGHHWTRWYQHPPTAVGDMETLIRIRREPDFRCTSVPSAVAAEIGRTREPYIEGRNRLFLSPVSGLICFNSLQRQENNGGRCRDYRVRFCCEQPPRRPPSINVRPPRPPPPSPRNPPDRNRPGSFPQRPPQSLRPPTSTNRGGSQSASTQPRLLENQSAVQTSTNTDRNQFNSFQPRPNGQNPTRPNGQNSGTRPRPPGPRPSRPRPPRPRQK